MTADTIAPTGEKQEDKTLIQKELGGIRLSGLGMGNMRLPVQNDESGAPIDRPRAQEIIDYAMENGINYFDTAYTYHNGESEKFLGDAMAKYPRESYYLATKFFILANPDYKAVFEEQLTRLKTDYIDFYLLHAIFDKTYERYMTEGSAEYFAEQKKLGRIGQLGFSFHGSEETLKKLVDARDWDFAQIQLNYYDWFSGKARREYEILQEHGIPVIAMEPVRGGRLAALSSDAEDILKKACPDWSLAGWALRWIKRLPQVRVVLSGMSTLGQIKENVALFGDESALGDEEEALLMRAYEAFRGQVQVPCTACRYCCDDCPAEIDIPAVLDVYNRYKTDGEWALNDLKEIDSKGMPKDCIECGVCSEHCPQSIDIPAIMQELAAKK